MTPDLRSAGRLVLRRTPDGGEVELVEKHLTLEAYDPETRGVTITASDETVDRYGDIVRASGWDLRSYQRNPVVLTDHDYRVASIVGTADVAVRDGRLAARITLDPPETNRQASIVANLLASGSLRSVSVGFRPLEPPTPILDETGKWTGGFEFKRQELLEISWVAVPANPNATLSQTPAGADAGAFLTALRETVQGLVR